MDQAYLDTLSSLMRAGNRQPIVDLLQQQGCDGTDAADIEAMLAFIEGDTVELADWRAGPASDKFMASLRSFKGRITSPTQIELPPSQNIRTIDRDFDFLEDTCTPRNWSVAQIIHYLLLSRISPSERIAVVISIRDEGVYFLEWLAHYRLLGVRDIFVYTNDNADGSDALLECLASHGLITLIKNVCRERLNPQRKANQHALHLLTDLRRFRWAFFADADEYLMFGDRYPASLASYLADVETHFGETLPAAILFPWRWRFTDRAFSRENTAVLGQYQHASIARRAKSIVNVACAFAMCKIHVPTVASADFFVRSDFSRIEHHNDRLVFSKQYQGPLIDHFFSKSFREFVIKKDRGDKLDLPSGNLKREFSHFFSWTSELSGENHVPIPRALVERNKAEVEKLMSHEDVFQANHAVLAIHRRRMADIGRDENYRKIYAELRDREPPILG
jgi:Glycosyl transferase family 2